MTQESGFTRFMKGYGRLTIFMIPIGIAINFVGGQIALLLKLPVYLDAIGTILVGAVCGALPGALVGAISNVINSITSPTNLPYGLLSIMFGLLAGWLSRLGVFKSWWKTLLSAIPFAFIGGVFGSIITIILFGGLGGGGGAIIVGALVAMGMEINTAVFVSAIPMDILDKVPTVMIVYLILKRIPKRLYVKLPLGHIYIKESAYSTSKSAAKV